MFDAADGDFLHTPYLNEFPLRLCLPARPSSIPRSYSDDQSRVFRNHD